MISFTKEAIAHRMIKNALSFWNLRSAEDLDPIVKMMVEALAVELYQLHFEQESTQVSILERVAHLMSPEYVTAPLPASSLLHMECIEKSDVIAPKHSFTYSRHITVDEAAGKQERVELFFSPAKPMRLHDLRPAVLITPRVTSSLDEYLHKDKHMNTPASALEAREIWLGLRSNNEFSGLENCALYLHFNSLSRPDAREARRAVPYFKWFYRGKQVNSREGLVSENGDLNPAYKSDILLDTSNMIERDVYAEYSPHYITLHDENIELSTSHKSQSPFDEGDPAHHAVAAFNPEKLYWLKIVVPLMVKPEWMEQINIYTNCVPVINRRYNEIRYKLKGNSRIVPLRAPTAYDQFLDIVSVSDERAAFTTAGSQQGSGQRLERMYTLIQGGLERFDARSAKAHILNLLELLRSESSSFSTFGYDFIASALRELSQKIELIEQKTTSHAQYDHEDLHYLLVQPAEKSSLIFADFWTTTGAFANGIKADTRLQPYKHTVVKSSKVFLVHTTAQGRNRPAKDDHLRAFRHSLMSRDAIITKQDIIHFCEMNFGDHLENVTVKNGMAYEGETRHAFKKTIDVILKPKEADAAEDWDSKCSWIESQLQTRSVMGVYYRVEVDI